MGGMTTQAANDTGVPVDSFEMRLYIARMHAGGISAREAAMRVGVSGQTWRNWEAGESVGAQKPAMLRYIAEQLGVDEGWLRHGGPLRPHDPTGGPQGGERGGLPGEQATGQYAVGAGQRAGLVLVAA